MESIDTSYYDFGCYAMIMLNDFNLWGNILEVEELRESMYFDTG